MGLSAVHERADPDWSDSTLEQVGLALYLHGRPSFTLYIWQQLASHVVHTEHTVLVRAYLEF